MSTEPPQYEMNIFDDSAAGIALHTFAFALCMWIVFAHSAIIISFIIYRDDQRFKKAGLVLGLSLIDLFGGLANIVLIVIARAEAGKNAVGCMFTFYILIVSHSATLNHILIVCIYRGRVLLRRKGVASYIPLKMKTCLIITLVAYVSALALHSIPQFAWIDIPEKIPYCRLEFLFKGNQKEATIFTACSYLIPIVITNVVYAASCFKIFQTRRRTAVAQTHNLTSSVYRKTISTTGSNKPTTNSTGNTLNKPRSSEHENDTSVLTSTLPNTANKKSPSETLNKVGYACSSTEKSEGITKNTLVPLSKTNDSNASSSGADPVDTITAPNDKQKATRLTSNSRMENTSEWSGAKAQRKALITIGWLLLMFNVFTLPLIGNLFFEVHGESKSIRKLRVIAAILFTLNSVVSPFVYALRSNGLQAALMNMLRKCKNVICCQYRSDNR